MRPIKKNTTKKPVAAKKSKASNSSLAAKKRLATRKRVAKRRSTLKKLGLRPIQIWVPDTRNKNFLKECRRQSLLVSNDPREKEILDWIEAAADHDGWE